jgi:hypothetical protein
MSNEWLKMLNSFVASEGAKTAIAAVAVVISITSLVITLREKRRDQRRSIVKALQGERESIALIAYRLYQEPESLHQDVANETVDALCMAWLFESSDRARAMVLAALRALKPWHEKRIQAVRTNLQGIADAYAKTPEGEVSKGQTRLKQLESALSQSVGA